MDDTRSDFFVSYNSADERWAEWISHVLEDAGYSVVVQAWDFRPGSNFVLEMQRALRSSDRLIAVLSPDYLSARYPQPEWAAVFAADPEGANRKLVPVMVRACEPEGLLGQIVQIRIRNLDDAAAAQRLLDGVSAGRSKPTKPPAFPGDSTRPVSGTSKIHGTRLSQSQVLRWKRAAQRNRRTVLGVLLASAVVATIGFVWAIGMRGPGTASADSAFGFSSISDDSRIPQCVVLDGYGQADVPLEIWIYVQAPDGYFWALQPVRQVIGEPDAWNVHVAIGGAGDAGKRFDLMIALVPIDEGASLRERTPRGAESLPEYVQVVDKVTVYRLAELCPDA